MLWRVDICVLYPCSRCVAWFEKAGLALFAGRLHCCVGWGALPAMSESPVKACETTVEWRKIAIEKLVYSG